MIELHCHTKMTKGKGLIAPDELVRYALDKGYKAIAVTDCENVQAFPIVYRTWMRLWESYQDEKNRKGEIACQKDFLKVIYGVEGNFKTEEGKIFKVLIFAKNGDGIHNLYRIITASNLDYYDENPLIPASILKKYSDGLLVGAPFLEGEISAAVTEGTDDEIIQKIADKYDFIEIIPMPEEKNLARKLYDLAGRINRPVVAASNAYQIVKEDKTASDILSAMRSEEFNRFNRCLKSHTEMEELLREMGFSGDEVANVMVNLGKIEEQIGYVSPLQEGKHLPEYPNADEELTNICRKRQRELFGDAPDFEVRKRLERELTSIRENGYAGIYMMWHQLVKKSMEAGYPTGIRGAVGSSFVAYLCDITEINPLSKENGGYNIPVEVFMGLNLNKEPDIDINFGSSIKGVIQKYVNELPGVAQTCYGGTISTIAYKTAQRIIEKYYEIHSLSLPDKNTMKGLVDKITGVKRWNGRHPGGIIVCPTGEKLVSFTPLTHAFPGTEVTTEFVYHEIDDNLLKLDILGHSQYDMLHALQEKTDVRLSDIPLEDKEVMKFICDTSQKEIGNLPEFGSEYVRNMITVAEARSFDDLVKISALSHGTDVWHGNQKELFERGQISLSDCIASRDDIMLYLMNMTMPKDDAYRIMDSVRKGKGLTYEQKRMMSEADVPEWYIQVCEKIRYLFPKAHAVSYTMMAVRLAYYMVYYPSEYYESLSEVS